MAIKKLKKSMKPLIAVFVVAFILTIVARLFGSLGQLTGGNYAFKLNGKKVEILKIEKAFQMGVDNFKQQYGESADVEELKLLIFNNLVEQELLLQNAKKLKVKVTDKDIDDQIQQIEGQFPDAASFEKVLQAQGFTRTTLRKEIEEKVTLDKVKAAIESQAKVTEEEVKAYYEENKYNTFFTDKTYDSIKKDIENSLIEKKKGEVVRAWTTKLMKEAKYKFPKIDKQENPYKAYQMVTAYEKEGFTFTNVDLANRKIMGRIQGIADEVALDKMAKEGIDKELKIVAKAKAANIKVDETLAKDDQISAYKEAYQNYLIANTKLTEEELQTYFATNAQKYDIAENYDVQLIELEIKAGPADEAPIKAKAESILKEALADGANFAELAKKYSEDGSAANGGSLGTFAKGQMVKEFEDAVFGGEKGKVIPKVIRTEFGYHIIKVDDKKADGSDVTASHILITFKVGPETIKAVQKKATDLAEKLSTNKTTFEKAAKEVSLFPDAYNFPGVKKGQYIQGIGQDDTLSKAMETAELNKVTVSVADRAYVFKKTKHSPFVKAEYNTVKNRVQYDLVREKVSEELSKLYQ